VDASVPDGSALSVPAGVCPYRVTRPVMMQRWETLAFLHWPVPSEEVQRLLPGVLSVELHDGTAWVGLVPFFMRVSLPGTGSVPWMSRFCETNVRTYVRDEAGRPGIWFFSLDAARLGAVVAARTGFRLPYSWSRMALSREGQTVRYTCRRRWPAGGPESDVRIEVGPRYEDREAAAGALPDGPVDVVQPS
jgi:uncharacterized protein YqjF (DUF2071 family)